MDNRRFDVLVAGVSKSVDESLLAFDEDGRVYKHYNSDMSLRVEDIQTDTDADLAKKVKEAKVEALDACKVEHNTVAYDAHGRAIGNMSAVMGVANFKYNQAVASGTSPAAAYQTVYKDTKINWKGADDKIHSVMIESVCEALEKAMLCVADIVVV